MLNSSKTQSKVKMFIASFYHITPLNLDVCLLHETAKVDNNITKQQTVSGITAVCATMLGYSL